MIRPRLSGVAALAGVLLAACADRGAERAAPPVPEPDLSRMERQVASALDAARREVLARPDSAEGWGELGSLYDAHSLFAAAETCYRRAVELAPTDFRWAYLLAVVRDIQGAGPDEVASLFGAAARLDPHYAAVHVRLGDNLARHGRYDTARTALERAVEQAPDLAVAHRMLGQVALAQGDLAAAEAHLSRAVEIEPRDQSATTALAQVYMRTDRAAPAEELAARAADLPRINVLDDPVYDRWVFERSLSASRALDRARIRIRDGDFAAAARDLELVLAAGGGGADVHALLGEAYAALGRAEDAARQLERAAALDPARRP